MQFDSGEHVLIGNAVTLYYPMQSASTFQYTYVKGDQVDFRQLVLPNLAQPLSFGEIAAATLAILMHNQDTLKGVEVNYNANQIIPNLSVLDNYEHYVDNKTKVIPMFTYNSKLNNVLRRKNLKQLYPATLPLTPDIMIQHRGFHSWWGWTILLELVLDRSSKTTHVDMQQLVTCTATAL